MSRTVGCKRALTAAQTEQTMYTLELEIWQRLMYVKNLWCFMLLIIFCRRCRVKRGMKDGDLVVCPDIECDNLKDAEHLASTLALYHLCRGQVCVQCGFLHYWLLLCLCHLLATEGILFSGCLWDKFANTISK